MSLSFRWPAFLLAKWILVRLFLSISLMAIWTWINFMMFLCLRPFKRSLMSLRSNITDSCFWGHSPKGLFSVFQLVLWHWGIELPDSQWKFIWKKKVPPKLKTFTWLLTQGKLNQQRVRLLGTSLLMLLVLCAITILSLCSIYCSSVPMLRWFGVNFLFLGKLGIPFPWVLVIGCC